MPPAPQHRTVLNWIQPSPAERFEIYSELGIPQAVLTITRPVQATLESRFGSYQIQRLPKSGSIAVTDLGGSTIATIRSSLWGRFYVTFDDGRELRFNASNVFRSRWLWSSTDGETQAVVQQNRIFFAPEWPIGDGLSALLAGLTIYFTVTKPSLFKRFMVFGLQLTVFSG
ncbi:hypothetical protein [Larkinella rosea]|uniref:Uncharacterized protein n=1 Tax=Larkinella rosea TaxID=2025312 RepID=A0A3P1BJJ0_9BACT|nr:hypothetical protein [Larkinella rosea]RRB00993.1 hypothetical protein EHT25_22700 [Larkinella rosea]